MASNPWLRSSRPLSIAHRGHSIVDGVLGDDVTSLLATLDRLFPHESATTMVGL